MPNAFDELIDSVADTILKNQEIELLPLAKARLCLAPAQGAGVLENALAYQVRAAFYAMDNAIEYAGFDDLGSNVSEGMAQGISDNIYLAEDAARDLGQGVEDATKDQLEMNSPSRVFMGLGENVVDGLVLGVENRQSIAEQTARTLALAFVDAAAQRINQSPAIDNAVRRQVELFALQKAAL